MVNGECNPNYNYMIDKGEIAKSFILNYPGKSNAEIARLLNTSYPSDFPKEESARKYVARVKKNGYTPLAIKVEETSSLDVIGNPLTETELRQKYDLRFIIQKKVTTIETGVFYSEADFIRLCGIRPQGGYRAILDHPSFHKYHGKAPGGVVYWGHPDSIQKMKNETILS